ncbi:MAG: hypothetical protein BGP21_06435 [Thiobacillus sp. 65-29]|nr:MAG: hypothetical protein BGP21_06435 [Thiobacillus sp. 65-29]
MLDDATMAERLYGTPKPTTPQAPVDEATAMAERLYPSTPKPEAKPAEPVSDPAARLFGGPDTEPAQDAPPRPHTDEEMQAILYPEPEKSAPLAEVPPEVQELRDLPERRMFDAQSMLRDVVQELTDEQCEAEGIDPSDARQAAVELREMAADLDLGVLDVRTLRTRVETLRSTPVETITQREAAVDALNREFGSGAKQALRDARALVARDARVARAIEAMGLGDDAETIVMLAKKARSQRVAGKLKNGKR